MLDAQQLRQQIIPVLETAGLIYQEQDKNDKRKILIFPTAVYGQNGPEQIENNGDTECGVNIDEFVKSIFEDDNTEGHERE